MRISQRLRGRLKTRLMSKVALVLAEKGMGYRIPRQGDLWIEYLAMTPPCAQRQIHVGFVAISLAASAAERDEAPTHLPRIIVRSTQSMHTELDRLINPPDPQ